MTSRLEALVLPPAVAAAAIVGTVVGFGWLDLESAGAQIVAASTLALGLIALGAYRSLRRSSRVDMFHPLIFPLAYVSVSFLVPLWITFVSGDPIRSFTRSTAIANNVSLLLGLGVAAFAAGAWISFRHRPLAEETRQQVSGSRLIGYGRAMLLLPITVAVSENVRGGVSIRGLDQDQYSLIDTLRSLVGVASLSGILLIVVGHRLLRARNILGWLDWFLVFALVAAIALRGSRSDAVAVIIALAVAQAWTRGRNLRAVVLLGVVVVFMIAVFGYRNAELGQSPSETPVEIIVGDMAVASYTTGATAAAVPDSVPYQRGGTVYAGLFRQLPSPLAVRVLGPPDDTGTAVFRRIVGFRDPNAGLGYSIPAEGYLNFGVSGLIGLCGLVGLIGSWAYSRANLVSGKAVGLLYVVFVATLPFGLRADVLGFTKNLLYPMIILSLAFKLARVHGAGTTSRNRAEKRKDAARAR